MGLIDSVIYDIREILSVHSDFEELVQSIDRGDLNIDNGVILNRSNLPNLYYNNILKSFMERYHEEPCIYNLTIKGYYFFNRKKRNDFLKNTKKLIELCNQTAKS